MTEQESPLGLHVGKWYLVNEIVPPPIPEIFTGMSIGGTLPQPTATPHKVLAINLPYIYTWTGHNFGWLDTRVAKLQRASRKFVSCFLNHTDGSWKPLTYRQRQRQQDDSYGAVRDPRTGKMVEHTQSPDCPACSILQEEARHDMEEAADDQPESGLMRFLNAIGCDNFPKAGMKCPRCGTDMLVSMNPLTMDRFPLCPKCRFQGERIEA